MVRITYVYIDMIIAFYGLVDFFLPIFTAELDVWAWLFGCMLFWVSYMHVFLYLHLFSATEHASYGKVL